MFRAYASKLIWAERSFSDCLAVLIAYEAYMHHRRKGYFERDVRRGQRKVSLEREWCRGRFLQQKALKDVETTVEELKFNLKRLRIVRPDMPNRAPLSWEDKTKYLQFAMFGAFYPNYFVRRYGTCDMKEVDKVIRACTSG